MASTLSPIRRVFLGWDQPALHEAARRLVERYRRGHALDLGQVIVVVPGQRAGRRLQELLAFLSEDENILLTPPRVITEGHLAEMLYTPKFPFANEIVQDLAWAKALRDLSPEKRQIVVPHPPAADDAVRWLQLAKVMRGLHVELAADGLDFVAVQSNGPKSPGFTEGKRWEALAQVQNHYLALLDSEKLWDIQTARLKAIEFREIATECDIILLGTVDLNTTLRHFLDQVASQVTAFIVAPESMADRFDEHGCLVPKEWCDVGIPLRDGQLLQVDGPVEQADAVSAWLSGLVGRYRSDEVAIGVPDVSLVPQLQRQLKQCGAESRWVEGVHIAETAPYRLLAAAVEFAGRRRYQDLAALLRHPDLADLLGGKSPERTSTPAADPRPKAMSLPAQLDRFYNVHLPNHVRTHRAIRSSEDWPDLPDAVKHIEDWLAEASTEKVLRAWGGLFRTILGEVYGSRSLDLDNPADEVLHRTFKLILDACEHFDELPEALDNAPFSAAEAFQVMLGPLANTSLPPPADPDAVEILGWLELPLDDSRALVVTSLNEGFVPQATSADAFLPDRLRRELGLLHNERRYARDAYAISVLNQSKEELRVLLARRDAANSPLQPSRLVFACEDDVLVQRARLFFAAPKASTAPRRLLLAQAEGVPEQSGFEVPAPQPRTAQLQRISVTRFKSYLACPYRYYLRHERQLLAVDDSARELDGSAFGILLHGALSELGRNNDAPRDSTRAEEINAFLEDRLYALAKERYDAKERRASIRLQLELARQRLKAFASAQAAQALEGWRIIHAEDGPDSRRELRVQFAVDGEPIDLVGRIDRIDFNEANRTLRILDYKSADRPVAPDKTHRKGEDWIDLQLPLYRHLVGALRLAVPTDCSIELGYFNLPKMSEETKVILGGWDTATLERADEVARQVIRDLRAGIFTPPKYPAPDFSEDFSAICLDNWFSRPAVSDDDEGGRG